MVLFQPREFVVTLSGILLTCPVDVNIKLDNFPAAGSL